MSEQRGSFRHESLQDRDATVEYLKAVIAGIEQGGLTLAADGDELKLRPQGLIEFRIAAKRGKHRGRLSMKLTWREEASLPTEMPPLQITPQAD